MFHECLGVVNAVPGEQGVCLGCLGVVFYCLGVFWGLLEGVSVLSEVSGSAFYSNLIYINCALIKSLTFSKRRGGPRCLKYQNVPTSRSFWPIGNPWERFQSWDIRIYFIPVPKDHTVALTWQEHLWASVWQELEEGDQARTSAPGVEKLLNKGWCTKIPMLRFLDALASLDFKLSVSQSVINRFSIYQQFQ